MTAQTEQAPALAGYRNALMVFREVAELTEKNPDFPRPTITFGPGKELTGKVYWHLTHYNYDYKLTTEQRKEEVRLTLENQLNLIIDTFGPDLDWVANDPSKDDFAKAYFKLIAEWKPGMKVEVMISRNDIGEMVDTIESGPQVMEQGGMVQLVRQTATVWTPNITIGRRSTPVYELEAKPLVLALTEADPF